MPDFDLHKFLTQQQEGGSIESECGFTVSTSEAARKLARFALPEPYSWVLKVLQAVVGWKAPELQIRQTRESTSFHFSPANDAEYPSRDGLFETLLSSEIGGPRPVQRLSIALRSLVEQSGLSFVLGVRASADEHYSVYAGYDVSRLNPKTRESWGQVRGKGIRLTVSHQMLGEHFTGRFAPGFMLRERRDLAIAHMIEKNALCIPIPVNLDGRRLDSIWSTRDLGFSSSHRPILISGVEAAPPHFPDLPMNLSQQRISIFQGQRSARVVPKTTQAFGSWFVLRGVELRVLSGAGVGGEYRNLHAAPSPNLAEPAHRVCWVRDGVVVSEEELRPSTPCWVSQLFLFINAEGLQTDLTGLSLVDSADKTERLRRALAGTSEQLRLEQEQVKSYTEEQPHANRQTLREECREDFIDSLPSALGFFRKVAAAGATGPYEFRQQTRIDIWERFLFYDLHRMAEDLDAGVEQA